jgi:ketosteroid isomerase-like protein
MNKEKKEKIEESFNENEELLGRFTESLKDIYVNQDNSNDKIVTRLEVIDKNGRVYVNSKCKIQLDYQDDGQTLKIIVKKYD